MKKRILLLLSLFIITFIVAILCYGYYLYINDLKQQKINKLPEIKVEEKVEEVSLIAVGDISYSRAVERIVKREGDINFPFLMIRDYLKSADIVFGNLETPITEGREIQSLEMVFRSNPGTEQALKDAGFTILSLANNHTPNYGETGLTDTFGYLDIVGIKHVGAGINTEEANRPVYIEKNGITFAFLAYNDSDVVLPSYEAGENHYGTAFMNIEKMTDAVKSAKSNADFVVVSMHSGIEYVNKPNSSQINFAHSAIDAGADLIIGHHPHVVQTMEKYNDKYIFYSLGNFVFDQPQMQETRDGLMVKIIFTKEGIRDISLVPVTMEKLAQQRIATSTEVDRILNRLQYTEKLE